MSMTELRAAAQALPRRDKFLLVNELLADLAQAEGSSAIECPVCALRNSYSAAAVLLRLLEEKPSATYISAVDTLR